MLALLVNWPCLRFFKKVENSKTVLKRFNNWEAGVNGEMSDKKRKAQEMNMERENRRRNRGLKRKAE